MSHAGRQRIAPMLCLALLAPLGLTACGAESRGCPSWVDYSDLGFAYTEANTVLVGHVVKRDGAIGTELGDVRAYVFAVEEVPKGEVSGDTIRIGSQVDPCDAGNGYVIGDPLATRERLLVFLRQEKGGLVTLAPGSGVVPFGEGEPLPFNRSR